MFFGVACNRSAPTNADTPSAALIPEFVVESGDKIFAQAELRDTVINNIAFKFKQITQQDFDSYMRRSGSPLALSEDKNVAEKKDSCVLVKLDNGKVDSLCAKREGENLMDYFVKGTWKGHRLVLLTYSDWEGGNDFFLNLDDGSVFNLGCEYFASSDENFLLSYCDSNESPINTSHLLFAKVDPKSIRTILLLVFEEITVTNAGWIGDNKCVLATDAMQGIDKPIQPSFYLLTIN